MAEKKKKRAPLEPKNLNKLPKGLREYWAKKKAAKKTTKKSR